MVVQVWGSHDHRLGARSGSCTVHYAPLYAGALDRPQVRYCCAFGAHLARASFVDSFVDCSVGHLISMQDICHLNVLLACPFTMTHAITHHDQFNHHINLHAQWQVRSRSKTREPEGQDHVPRSHSSGVGPRPVLFRGTTVHTRMYSLASC